MDRANKEKLVVDYVELFNKYESVFLVKNLGLSVVDSRSIRGEFKSLGTKFMVIKNSLAKIAVDKTKFSNIKNLFVGSVAIAYADDPVSTSKLLVKLCDEGKKLEIIGGAILDKRLEEKDVFMLSKMLTQEEIRNRIVTLLNAVADKVVAVLRKSTSQLAKIMKFYAKKH